MEQPDPEFVPPLVIYLVFLVSAFVIGDRSCSGGLAFYTIIGLVSLPVLLAVPYVVSRQRHPATKFALGMLYSLLGVVAWAGSFLISGMNFMCRLF